MQLLKETNLYDDEAINRKVAEINSSIEEVNARVVSTYGICTTSANIAAKVVSLADFKLFVGARITVQFTYANTAANPTLNVNSSGAKPIWARDAAIIAQYYWSAQSRVDFVYDGSHWTMPNAKTQSEIFNELTNNGVIRGIFMQDNQMYVNMDYLQTGTLKLGGVNNQNGLMEVYDASSHKTGEWNRYGFWTEFWATYGRAKMSCGETASLPSYYGGVTTGNQSGLLIQGKDLGDTDYTAKRMLVASAAHGGSYVQDVSESPSGFWWCNRFKNGDTVMAHWCLADYEGIHACLYGYDAGYYHVKIQKNLLRFSSLKSTSYKNSGTGQGFFQSDCQVFIVDPEEGSGIFIGDMAHYGIFLGHNNSTVTFYKQNTMKYLQVQSSSSKRYKHNITADIDDGLDAHKLYGLRFKQFVYNDDHLTQYQDMKGKTIPGFIAEEVDEIYPAATIHDHGGNIESWDERRIIPPMLALIQEQKKKIDELEETVNKFKQVIHVA